MRRRSAVAATLAVWPLAGAAAASTRAMSTPPPLAAAPARQRPPEQAACPRDVLTSYDGRPLRYARGPGRTALTIRTDWDTTETVHLLHPGSDDPARWFLLAGQPFQPGDWARIETVPGRLRPGLRVVAWVCSDGRNPLLDWQPPPR